MNDEASEYNVLDEVADADIDRIILSKVYHVKVGGFGDSKDKIITYQSCLRIEDLKDDLTTFDKIPKDASWPVSEIFQREIDYSRVMRISQYLTTSGRIKYFPPLTVAILPKDDHNRIERKYDYDNSLSETLKEHIANKSAKGSNLRKYILGSQNISQVNGIYLLRLSKAIEYDLLCWNKNKYCAVVIDGQHRFEGLLETARNDNRVYEYTQDIVFIDLSNLIKSQEQITPVKAVRSIFHDINSNADRITKAREYLLSDKNLASVFLQSLINDENEISSYIRPQVIDWHGLGYKHDLPHITSILVLYQLMSDEFIGANLSSLEDLSKKSKIKKWCDFLRDYLNIDYYIKTKTKYKDLMTVEELYKRYEDLVNYPEVIDLENKNRINKIEESDTPIFEFDYQIFEVAKEAFEEKFLKAFVLFFNETKPYADLLKLLDEEKAFDRSENVAEALIKIIENEKKFKDSKEEEFKKFRDSFSKLKAKCLATFHPKYYLIYTVLGQKALFSLYIDTILEKSTSKSSESEYIGFTKSFIQEVNRMFTILDNSDYPLFAKIIDKRIEIGKENFNEYLVGKNEYLGNLISDFWESIIYYDYNIIYNSQGIRSLSSIYKYILFKIKAKENNSSEEYEFDIPHLKSRIERRIKRSFREFEGEIEEISEEIIKLKQKFLDDSIEKCYKKWKANT